MSRCCQIFAAAILLTASWASAPASAEAPPSGAAKVQSALSELDRFLGSGDNGQRWHAFLRTEELRVEAAKGSQADMSTVAKVLSRYEGPQAGLELPQFVAVRRALAAWSAELSAAQADNLPQMARDAAQRFRPVAPQDVAATQAELNAALGGLDALLRNSPRENDAGWRRYLRWDELVEQARRSEGPDPKVVEPILAKLGAQENGLEMPQFRRVRHALKRHLETSQVAADAKLQETYAQRLEELAKHLENFDKTHSGDDAIAITRALGWLARHRQAGDLIAAVQRRYFRPNLYGTISQRFLSAGIDRDVDQTQGVTDLILGTSIYGTAHTTGRTTVELVPNSRAAQMDILLTGQALSNNVGYNGPVTIYSTGYTSISGRKTLLLTPDGMTGYPASASCATSTNIYAISAQCCLIEELARKRARNTKSRAEAIASDHAAARVAGQMDYQAGDLIADANERYVTRLRTPLVRRDAFPPHVSLASSADTIELVVTQAGHAQIGAPAAPPNLAAAHDVTVRAHESAVVNFAEAMIGGVMLTDERLEKIIREDLQAEVPEELQITPDKEPWSITFAEEVPVRAQFAGGGLSMAIRGTRFTRGDQAINEPIEISAKYTIEKTATGSKLTRQGEVEVTFLERERLAAQQVAFKTFLTRKFSALFKPEFVSEGVVLKGRLEKAGKLQVQEIASDRGWIVLGWQLAQPAAATAARSRAHEDSDGR
jgi:hypothetical protein